MTRGARLWQRLLGEEKGGLAALLTFAAALTLLLSLLPAQGLTDDDDFYAPAGISYASWLGEALMSPGEAFSRAAIDRAFKPNHEHPPFAKYVIGVAHGLTHRGLGLFGSLDGARAGVAFLCALLCAFLVRLLWRPLGPGTALLSVALLLSLPRFFFHSQVATLDVPVATMVVLTTAAFFWGERSPRWAWATGVIFGLALLTKLNAPFAAIPATLYAVLARWRGFSLSFGEEGAALVVPPVPRSLLAMALLGPALFLALWPWLWFDTLERLGAYFAFHLSHYPIFLFYEGEIFSKPFAPWHMAFTMAAGVTPMPVLLLGLFGVGLALASLLRLARGADADGAHARVSSRDRLLALVLLQAFFAIGIVAFSHVPKYGGEKLFMPFFPLFCVLAAAGLAKALEGLALLVPALSPGLLWFRSLDERSAPEGALFTAPPPPRWPALALLGAGLLAALPGAAGTVRFHGGYALSYYSEVLGGLAGATARGYERTYYDVADKELARWLDDNARGEGVHFEPNHKEYERTYRWLKKDGVVSRELKLERNKERASVLVLTHERRWSTYPRLYDEHRRLEKVHDKRIDGVPLYTVYRRAKRSR
jgi:4-amino-4-deoxy-L-arabinose transferase-like glycosyltransferase